MKVTIGCDNATAWTWGEGWESTDPSLAEILDQLAGRDKVEGYTSHMAMAMAMLATKQIPFLKIIKVEDVEPVEEYDEQGRPIIY